MDRTPGLEIVEELLDVPVEQTVDLLDTVYQEPVESYTDSDR